MSASNKRKRRESSPPPAASPPPTRSDQFWLPHGDVVLQVTNTQFRVNRDVLARQSIVFRDMFSLPQTTDGSPLDAVVEGCPVVEMSGDSLQDWEAMLEVFYDPFVLSSEIPWKTAAAMLRLGKKYQMDAVFGDAAARFHNNYPRTFMHWKNPKNPRVRRLMRNISAAVPVFLLLREIGITSCIPSAAFVLLRDYSLSDIFAALDKAVADPAVREGPKSMLALAAEHMCKYQKQTFAWLEDSSVIPSPGCIRAFLCTEVRASKLSATQWAGNDLCEYGFCGSCDAAGRKKFDGDRWIAWEKLPGFFGLPEWAELKDMP
ncbi:BTB domain-containing protein [Mycena kentingensis (nom. inval.)]|nr:BTB domain-containing protein [Mycena kentingensis (nom. inval.)]